MTYVAYICPRSHSVVLVHGLSGHYIDTWKSADDNDDTLWPSDFLPHYLPGVRVLSYSYNASIKGTTSPHMIRNRAHKLLQLLRDRREEGSTAFIPIIFVGHSLGGVIIKQVSIPHRRSGRQHQMLTLEAQALRIAFDNSAHYREIAISACGVVRCQVFLLLLVDPAWHANHIVPPCVDLLFNPPLLGES